MAIWATMQVKHYTQIVQRVDQGAADNLKGEAPVLFLPALQHCRGTPHLRLALCYFDVLEEHAEQWNLPCEKVIGERRSISLRGGTCGS